MKYVSTRGQTDPMPFTDAGLTGLAPDGGLLIPETLPDVSGELERWAELSYPDLAFEVFQRFTDLPEATLRTLVNASYATFRHPETTPLVRAGSLRVLELFHGPTLAFKDVAMQFLARFFEHALEERDLRMNILGSTSGDTGSAAIHGVRGKARIQIFMMHPEGRTSPIQALQMTSVLDNNVHNLAIDGTFDDCQRIMKTLFADVPFKEKHFLGAVNSVNWIRVMAQIVYYLYAGLRALREEDASSVQFSVPTGNFGNILAGFYAAQMGLPVSRLILATNENDILSRFFQTGAYTSGEVAHTLSPSMDIQVASNFERYLHALLDGDSGQVRESMAAFSRDQRLDLSERQHHPVRGHFAATRVDTETTLATIRKTWEDHGMVLDPHTAVGVAAGKELRVPGDPLVCLATAHPAKFTQAIEKAIGVTPTHPVLDALQGAPTRCDRLPAQEEAVREYLQARA